MERLSGRAWNDCIKVSFRTIVWVCKSRGPQVLYDDADLKKYPLQLTHPKACPHIQF